MKMILSYENYRKVMKRFSPLLSFQASAKKNTRQDGFSLIEVCIAMVVFLIAILGVFVSFVYAVNYNSGNSSRAQALALLQQKVEQMRSATFVPTATDSALVGGTKASEPVTGADGHKYRFQVVVDDDPFAPGINIDPTSRFKEISVTVTLEAPTPGWQSSVPATVILRRVRGN
jgi:prepilin-type N-terminal cleavage/methylation domain-containing protein